MSTITSKAPAAPAPTHAPATPMSLAFIVETLFATNLREKIDADTKGDKSDAAYTWGM